LYSGIFLVRSVYIILYLSLEKWYFVASIWYIGSTKLSLELL
jgi:hypothetical protein